MATIKQLLACFIAAVLLNIPGDRCMQIIGGKEAKPHSWPFMALIQGGHLCGGTLIKEQWVLTAAHCQRKNMKVTLGAHSISMSNREQKQFSVSEAIPHQKFSNKTRKNDLMLLKLNEPVKTSKYISYLTLPAKVKDVKEKTLCKVAGWGVTDKNSNKGSDKLMAVEVQVISRRQCQKAYRKTVISSSMICAWDNAGKKNTGKGDSGGPLICNGKLTAVVSFGSTAAQNPLPGVYTLLTNKHLKWIHMVTGGAE